MRRLLTLFLAAIVALAAFRTEALEAATDTIGARIYFHQSKVKLLPDYEGNKARLDSFIRELHRIQQDPSLRFRSIRIMGGASPEGTIRFNRWLSRNRADRITEYLHQNSLDSISDSDISFEYPGVDWAGLKKFVMADTLTPDREQVLYIIDHPGPGDDRVPRLKKLNYNIPWRYLYLKYYPPLRASQIQIIYDRILDSLIAELPRFHYIPPIIAPPMKLTPRPMLPFYAAIKTNMIYDAALIPNIGIDIYLGNNWSGVVNWEYAWWKSDARHWYHRCYGGDIEVRKWLGKKALEKPLTGHHLGPYFQLLTYDFEWGKRGYQGRRWTKAAGIAYGYSLPVRDRINIDFTIGLGYHWGEFYEYLPIDNHYVWQKTRNRRAITPTKIEVSFVWLIGNLNSNDEDERRGRK